MMTEAAEFFSAKTIDFHAHAKAQSKNFITRRKNLEQSA